ncbi:hypothetical protein GCM10010198_27900 [Nocardia seriolae]|nr:hypothetical protein NSER024013_05490 [Nocardia seriolae]
MPDDLILEFRHQGQGGDPGRAVIAQTMHETDFDGVADRLGGGDIAFGSRGALEGAAVHRVDRGGVAGTFTTDQHAYKHA